MSIFRFLSRRFFSRGNYPIEKPVRFQDVEVVVEDIKDLGEQPVFYTGTFAPLSTLGKPGDTYIQSGDAEGATFYQKDITNTWVLVTTFGIASDDDQTLAYLGL